MRAACNTLPASLMGDTQCTKGTCSARRGHAVHKGRRVWRLQAGCRSALQGQARELAARMLSAGRCDAAVETKECTQTAKQRASARLSTTLQCCDAHQHEPALLDAIT